MARALTDIAIRNLRPEPKRREIPDPGARGLYVIVQPSGVKSFAVRYRYAGVSRKVTLQSGISLAAARKATADALYELERGHDPGVARLHARQAQRLAAQDTFKAVAEEYQKREGSRLRSAEWRQGVLERLVYPTLGDRPISLIKRSEIIRLLDKITEGTPLGVTGGPFIADRALAIIRRVMNWHATRSDDFRSPIVRGMARAEEAARTRTLSDVELRGPFDRLVLRLLRARARREGEDYEEAIAQDYASNPEAMEMIRQYLAKYPPERLGDLTPIYPKDSVMEEGGVLKEPARIFLRALAIASKREG